MNKKGFAHWLSAARKDKNLSQFDLAEKVDLTKGRISQLESGLEIPTLDNLVAFATALGADAREPLKALGVISEQGSDLTGDEQMLISSLRMFDGDTRKAALEIIEVLGRLKGGKAHRSPKKTRPAKGGQDTNSKQEKAS
jgi:transcriptional regulator with XRE-family HTH domain